MTITMIVQLLIVLLALWVGSRYGSLALGAISGIGLAILVFGWGLKPGTPPTDVIYIIIAAVTCAGVLQASGGMDWMIQVAEKATTAAAMGEQVIPTCDAIDATPQGRSGRIPFFRAMSQMIGISV